MVVSTYVWVCMYSCDVCMHVYAYACVCECMQVYVVRRGMCVQVGVHHVYVRACGDGSAYICMCVPDVLT